MRLKASHCLLLVLLGGGLFSIYPLSLAHANDRITSHEVVELSRGMLLQFGIGSAIAPLLGGLVMARLGPVGFFVALGTVAALLLVVALAANPMPHKFRSVYVGLPSLSSAASRLDPRRSAGWQRKKRRQRQEASARNG